MKAIEDEAQQERVEASREAAKLAKKAEFDSKYDGGGSRAVDKVGGGSDDEEDATAANDGDTQEKKKGKGWALYAPCLLYTSPSPRDRTRPRMPSSA